MEAHQEIPEHVLTGSAENPAGVADVRQGSLASTPLARATQPGRKGRRRGLWALLVITLGTAAYGFAYLNRPWSCYQRALKALGRDDFDQARYELLRLQGLPEYEPHACVINGILLLQEQNPDDALDEFQLALDHPETRVLALTLAGRTLLRQGKFQDAEAVLQRALEYDPDVAEVHRCLGAAYFDAGDFRRSLVHFERAGQLSLGDPNPYQFMSVIHLSFHQTELAIDDLREMLLRGVSGSTRQDALLDMAQLQSQLLLHQEAIDTLKDADESSGSLALLAECEFNLGHLEAARDHVARALRTDPDNFDAIMVQARLDMEAKAVNPAVEGLKRAEALRPHNGPMHTLLSQTLHALGQDELAEQHAREAARIVELEHQYSELCNVALEEPRNALTCFRLGLMAERLDMQTEAAGWYRAVLLVDPTHAKAREHLSELPGGPASLGGQPTP
ncbi:MAG TPA: tetratricopeptide repeat protein [Pirellulales bacterium]|nr:tetratricopeptide repeat protein [Pirellulales bacterium]